MSNQRIDLDDLAVTLQEQGRPWRSGETSMTKLPEAEVRIRLGFRSTSLSSWRTYPG